MTIKLVATDLDGTLIHRGKISPEDRKTLEEVIQSGIPVLAVTTRMRHSASVMLKDTNIFRFPGIFLNGAHIIKSRWDGTDYEELHCEKLDLNLSKDIARYADEKGYEVTTIFKEKKYWKKRRSQSIGPHPEDSAAIIVEKNSDAINDEPPVSFMMHEDFNSIDGLRDMENFVNDKMNKNIVSHRHHRMGVWIALTIYPRGTFKFSALRTVCKDMEISLKDVIALGDDEVDKEMLNKSGVGVIMDNAPDHLKKTIDVVAPSCIENGFSWAMKEFVL